MEPLLLTNRHLQQTFLDLLLPHLGSGAVGCSDNAPQKQLPGHLPKEFFLQILPSTPATGVLGYELVCLATPHSIAVLLGKPHSRNREAVRYIHKMQDPPK